MQIIQHQLGSRERPRDAEMKAIETHGLYNWGDFRQEDSGEVELKVMQEMFEASADGEAYDADKFGLHFHPQAWRHVQVILM